MGKDVGDKWGLGYTVNRSSSGSSNTIFVPARNQTSTPTTRTTTVFPPPKTPPICHYCGVKGHIKPICWKLRKDSKGKNKKNQNEKNKTHFPSARVGPRVDHASSSMTYFWRDSYDRVTPNTKPVTIWIPRCDSDVGTFTVSRDYLGNPYLRRPSHE